MSKPGTIYYFDGINRRMVAEDVSSQTDRFRLKAIKFMHTLHPLASLIQRLFDNEKIDAQQRDVLFVWVGTFAFRTNISESLVIEQEKEFHSQEPTTIIANEMSYWQSMSAKERDWWGPYNFPEYAQRIQEDFPLDTSKILILHPSQRQQILEGLSGLVNQRASILIQCLALCFRIARLAEKQNQPRKGFF